ncbi:MULTISPECIES: linalool dehydratase/isomerase domain-containing protein [unclassified Sphingomonas]|uniref:linalool dehydratase/isomerase domain-containing protein n=1 Tax=unclassified Sphingomonas TaxID=196159 RepID=UPI0006FA60E3|nr:MULTISPECIES: hypothetical protein [unclassified Sphingomonas]KQX22812.1 hypothetical protein ASD17_05950 [Sphingomonas sp. Root1294]KQY67708.1 hypothetical protein ASD39_07170 [Sphingomonas sp. Root50]KRB88650.1 hypothetical protein ASE22_19635 [Sphingomonas sp. Root720]
MHFLKLAAFGMALVTAGAQAAVPKVDPADYPELTDKEIGHVRHMIRLSRQLPGDWSGMGSDMWSVAERTIQFQLSYMATALGLVQHSYTPAYREAYQPAMDALIQKMTLPDVWELWLNSSRAGTFRSKTRSIQPGWVDPVRKYNIMLKGYLLQAGAMYDMLYQDGRYDRPGAFTFRHIPATWANGPQTFRYTLGDVARIVHQEYVDSDYAGVQCEPNVVFPQCNQPPILGLINYDQSHGTHYAADIMPKFKAQWSRIGYTDAKTGQNIGYMRVSTGAKVGLTGPVGDGWSNSWMNVWNPELVRDIYPKLREQYYRNFVSGAYARNVPSYGNKDMIGLGFGQYAFMAAEVGDGAARAAMLAYADRNFNPVWENGEYYYPRSDDYAPDAGGNSRGVDSWTGNVLIALARLDKGDGFRKLYASPWTAATLRQPYVSGIDYRTTNVSRAWYDAGKRALVVTLKPGPVKAKATRFTVNQLQPGVDYVVLRDGVEIGRVGKGSFARRADGTVQIGGPLDKAHSYVIVAG